jgi:hypothetical protein
VITAPGRRGEWMQRGVGTLPRQRLSRSLFSTLGQCAGRPRVWPGSGASICHVAEREASGDFEYELDDPVEADGLTSHDQVTEQEAAGDFDYLLMDPDDDQWADTDANFWDQDEPPPPEDDRFDAFDMNTWHFEPTPIPWYRTRQATAALVATAAAVVAIVVSGVLLVFRGPIDVNESTTVTPTAPTSAPQAPVASTAAPPPELPPPPPPPPSAEQVDPAPTVRYRPTVQPRPTKQPEIGVTRTPATRSPISVAPQPRKPAN